MNIGALLIGIALWLICLMVLSDPFRGGIGLINAPAGEMDGRLVEETRDVVLHRLLALDFDYELGQISQGDYAPLRESLLEQAGKMQPKTEIWTDERLEDLIRARRTEGSVPSGRSCTACHRPLQPDDRFCRFCGAPQGIVCPDCGNPSDPADTYCPHCGRRHVESDR